MTFATALSAYLSLNLLVVVAFLALRFARAPSAAAALKLHYRALGAVFFLAALHPALPKRAAFGPSTAKIWAASSMRDFASASARGADRRGGVLALPGRSADASPIDADRVSRGLGLASLLLLFFAAFRMARDLRVLRAIRRDSYRVRRIGRVSIYASDAVAVPFSCWAPGRADVVVPAALASRPLDYRMAIAHELQHHRQADTRGVYAIWALKALCFANPFAYRWGRLLSEIQEFACDETLVDRNKVESGRYARCLVEAAETALGPKPRPACATGLAFRAEGTLLRRRIEKMVSKKSPGMKRSIGRAAAPLVFALLAVTAFASREAVQDRRVSAADARKMAEQAKRGSDFPIVVNDRVVAQLNRYLGTPEGRDFMKQSLARMEAFRPMVEGKIKEYGAPAELLAIPIVESGYRDLEIRDGKNWIAGIWMFIAPTARAYGLRVEEKDGKVVDDRRDAKLLTDAAMRYLKADRLKFNDWLLSILAYNAGEKAVQAGIEKAGSRDAWTLVQNGVEGDKDYLAKVMAAVLILRNPGLVD